MVPLSFHRARTTHSRLPETVSSEMVALSINGARKFLAPALPFLPPRIPPDYPLALGASDPRPLPFTLVPRPPPVVLP